jgi:membrane protein implicated in regulation of membrane protease activity
VCQFYFYLVISLLRNMGRIEWLVIGLLLLMAGLLVSLGLLLWSYG